MNNGISEPFRDGISEPFYDGVSGGGHSVVLGPELIVNGDFSDGATHWSALNGDISVVNGQLNIATNTTEIYCRLNQNNIFVPKHRYQVKIDFISAAASFSYASILLNGAGGLAFTPVIPSSITVEVVAENLYHIFWIYFYFYSGGFVQGDGAVVDNISVKEILIV